MVNGTVADAHGLATLVAVEVTELFLREDLSTWVECRSGELKDVE